MKFIWNHKDKFVPFGVGYFHIHNAPYPFNRYFVATVFLGDFFWTFEYHKEGRKIK